MKNKAVVSLIVVALACVLIYYWAGKKDAEPLEPADGAAATVADNIGPRTGNHRMEAADLLPGGSKKNESNLPNPAVSQPPADVVERFHSTRACNYDSTDLAGYESVLVECEAMAGIERLAADYKQCSALTTDRKKEIGIINERMSKDGCDTHAANFQREYFEATRAAAKAGDADAQLCYLESNFNLSFSSANQQEYAKVAPVYVRQAFQRGDWRAVLLLSRDTYPPGLLGQVVEADPLTLYKLNRLLRRGADGTYGSALDIFAQTLTTTPGSNGTPYVDSRQAAAADRWVDETYSKFFSSSPPVDENMPACGR